MNKRVIGFIGRQHWLDKSTPPLAITFVPTSLLTFFQQLGYETLIIDIDNDIEIIKRLDVLILNGGFEDIDPDLYGASKHSLTANCNKQMDQFEIQAVHFAIKSGIPILGICRGFQLINVAMGGTLHQDLSSIESDVQHINQNYRDPVHRVITKSWLKDLLGESVDVNSYHHQGIDELAEELTPLAWADDGLVEAYELKHAETPLFAIQWHPELLVDDHSFLLVETFLKHCEGFLSKKNSGIQDENHAR
ncbi:gamma-glutamyl-gamma-aminobutyrate hydrolase family protein [Bacillus sp. V3B]|uniref:gamma-glutamyl-gamma-aminobutyrate hydrolase family protein n=1 Tax=Bacillus sp. V3B TaxID=2804915 RepID=UPI00210C6F91|nr:gamma-glutamyl-gamma-aminobutyrate hydrolase family protein [Bacillus sp. V3B]MCQ6277077.1 gamma-glutamyl-gamma-aminobutyrate hydrolase family protein [Bacillus sp. V3B]